MKITENWRKKNIHDLGLYLTEYKIGDDSMCQALLEIMELEINEIVESKVQKKIQEKIQESILIAVKGFRDLGANDEKIKEILMSNYELTAKEAALYL